MSQAGPAGDPLAEESLMATIRPSRAKAVRGMAWTGGSFAFRLLMFFAVTAILARLLAPADFGLVGMAAVIINFILLFQGQGLNTALVQHDRATRDHFSSAFWFLLAAGVAMSALVVAISPVIAWVYDESRLIPVVALSGLSIFIGSLSGCHGAVLLRKGEFRTVALREMIGEAFSAVVAISLAFAGFGVYSLVLKGVAATLFRTVFLWVASGWHPSFRFRFSALRDVLGFGANMTGFEVANYLYRNLDLFLIGKFLGAAALGFYSIGQRIIRMTISMIAATTSRVMFTALSRVVEKDRFREIYIESNRLLTAVLFLPLVGLIVLAEPFVFTLYGPKWATSAPLIQLFAAAGLLQVTGTTLGWIYKARGRPDLMFKLAMLVQPVTIAGVVVGLQWGILGVAVAHVIVAVLIIYPVLAVPFSLIDLRVRDLVFALRSIIAAAVLAGSSMWVALRFIIAPADLLPIVVLLTVAALGATVYGGALFAFDRHLFAQARRFLTSFRKPANDP